MIKNKPAGPLNGFKTTTEKTKNKKQNKKTPQNKANNRKLKIQ